MARSDNVEELRPPRTLEQHHILLHKIDHQRLVGYISSDTLHLLQYKSIWPEFFLENISLCPKWGYFG